MRRRFLYLSLLIIVITGHSSFAQNNKCVSIDDKPEVINKIKDLINNRKAVFLLRHTDKGGEKTTKKSCEDTSKALTRCGKDQAQLIRLGFARMGLDHTKVISSDYCRTIETAEIVFGVDNFSMDSRLGSKKCSKSKIKEVINENRTKNEDNSLNYRNIVIVTHSNCIENFVDGKIDTYENLGLAVLLDVSNNLKQVACIERSQYINF